MVSKQIQLYKNVYFLMVNNEHILYFKIAF